VDSSLQRGSAAHVVRPRHSRFAGNHDCPGAVFATSSRRSVCRSRRINLVRTASRIFADARRRETELMRTTTSILALCGRDLLCRGSAPRATPAMFQPTSRLMRQRPNVRLHGGSS
jgi:hypothetical protein